MSWLPAGNQLSRFSYQAARRLQRARGQERNAPQITISLLDGDQLLD
jgi:hypothetical protein